MPCLIKKNEENSCLPQQTAAFNRTTAFFVNPPPRCSAGRVPLEKAFRVMPEYEIIRIPFHFIPTYQVM